MNLFRMDFNPSFLGNFLELLVNDTFFWFCDFSFWNFYSDVGSPGLCLFHLFLSLPPLSPIVFLVFFVDFSKLIL